MQVAMLSSEKVMLGFSRWNSSLALVRIENGSVEPDGSTYQGKKSQ